MSSTARDVTAPRVDTTTLFHCSDLHFGYPAVPEQYEWIESIIAERRYNVVAVSGDLTQRARSGEFQRARVFLQHAKRHSEVIVVPGNHDVAWWKAPLGFGKVDAMLANYKRYISEDIEPVLRDCRTRELAVSVLSCPEREHSTLLPITTLPSCGSAFAGRPSSTWAASRLTPCGPWTCRNQGPHGTTLEFRRVAALRRGRDAVVAGVREL